MRMQTEPLGSEGASVRRDLRGIETAVELITKDTRQRESRCLERRSDSRLPFQRPVEIVVLDDDGTGMGANKEPIMAYTRNISSTGVGLLHDQAIQSNRVLLNFELLGGEIVGLVASLTWCRYLGDFWYCSGGRLIGVPVSCQ